MKLELNLMLAADLEGAEVEFHALETVSHFYLRDDVLINFLIDQETMTILKTWTDNEYEDEV